MYCKDCKWSNSLDNGYAAMSQDQNFMECTNKKIAYREDIEDEDVSSDMLLYQDYEGYSAGVSVGENFGCVHFRVNNLWIHNTTLRLGSIMNIALKLMGRFRV